MRSPGFPDSCSALVQGQVKFRIKSDNIAERAIRPLGIPRDPNTPLPYLTLLMEFGIERKIKNPIEVKVFQNVSKQRRVELQNDLEDAQKNYEKVVNDKMHETVCNAARKVVHDAQEAYDNVGRFSIAVYGATSRAYRILDTAKLEQPFQIFLNVISLSRDAEAKVEPMRPLRSLDPNSTYNRWMVRYQVPPGYVYEQEKSDEDEENSGLGNDDMSVDDLILNII
ncbi:hypothetical protein BD410DRAFT_846131 [Rickenella mellea]|uniref:Uncharacterized protein n=1 Tax=Rickenella mellea TaxID=50990 RepID=A0A4Y7PIT7_9AGAM|nr:hypothetical protein BD410DRAFT_846131 [Rickenella mellea]